MWRPGKARVAIATARPPAPYTDARRPTSDGPSSQAGGRPPDKSNPAHRRYLPTFPRRYQPSLPPIVTSRIVASSCNPSRNNVKVGRNTSVSLPTIPPPPVAVKMMDRDQSRCLRCCPCSPQTAQLCPPCLIIFHPRWMHSGSPHSLTTPYPSYFHLNSRLPGPLHLRRHAANPIKRSSVPAPRPTRPR